MQTIILSSSVLYELAGPACAKLSLYLSHSYSNKIENVVQVDEKAAEGKNDVELLIERINKIRQELPQDNPAEKAYTEAAENFDIYYPNQRKFGKRRR